MHDDEYLTIAEAIRETGHNRRTFMYRIEDGRLPATKAVIPGAVGEVWRIKRSDLDKLQVRKYVRRSK